MDKKSENLKPETAARINKDRVIYKQLLQAEYKPAKKKGHQVTTFKAFTLYEETEFRYYNSLQSSNYIFFRYKESATLK